MATTAENIPYVRSVNAFYSDGAFYILTHQLSNKMKQIEANPVVAVAGEWFTAQGIGENIGYFASEENTAIADQMKRIFASWIDQGHNDFSDINTCILKIQLSHALLFSHGKRYEIDFSEE